MIRLPFYEPSRSPYSFAAALARGLRGAAFGLASAAAFFGAARFGFSAFVSGAAASAFTFFAGSLPSVNILVMRTTGGFWRGPRAGLEFCRPPVLKGRGVAR